MTHAADISPLQRKALGWVLECQIEITAEKADGYEPHQAVEEISHLAALAELSGDERLASLCEQLRVEAQARVDALPPSPPEIELPLMLVLSTAHITQATAGLFEMKTDDLPIHHDKGEYGWIIPLKTGCDWPHTCPPELIKIRDFAQKLGADWIMLDRDADLVEGLQSWEW